MLTIHGQIMIERVIAALLDSGCCAHVYVSIDDESVLRKGERLRDWMNAGQVSAIAAEGNLADSMYTAAQQIPDEHWPLLITTGDNALHTPPLIRAFVAGAFAEPCDAALGLTREEVVTAEIPDAACTGTGSGAAAFPRATCTSCTVARASGPWRYSAAAASSARNRGAYCKPAACCLSCFTGSSWPRPRACSIVSAATLA